MFAGTKEGCSSVEQCISPTRIVGSKPPAWSLAYAAKSIGGLGDWAAQGTCRGWQCASKPGLWTSGKPAMRRACNFEPEANTCRDHPQMQMLPSIAQMAMFQHRISTLLSFVKAAASGTELATHLEVAVMTTAMHPRQVSNFCKARRLPHTCNTRSLLSPAPNTTG